MDKTEQQILYLRLALGDSQFNYMVRSLQRDKRLRNAHTADIVIRKDGIDRRVEADWLKTLAEIVDSVEPPPL